MDYFVAILPGEDLYSTSQFSESMLIGYAHCPSSLLHDMTSTGIICTLLIIVVPIITVICKEHVPSLNEISKINDPVLKEVFDSSNISVNNRASYEETPRLVSSGSSISTQESEYIEDQLAFQLITPVRVIRESVTIEASGEDSSTMSFRAPRETVDEGSGDRDANEKSD
uniref:Ovule protein n=1 Tax=Heterorhabditis bacteriophora TaxID=37862 RepID=A0A1I7WQA5_HETBA